MPRDRSFRRHTKKKAKYKPEKSGKMWSGKDHEPEIDDNWEEDWLDYEQTSDSEESSAG